MTSIGSLSGLLLSNSSDTSIGSTNDLLINNSSAIGSIDGFLRNNTDIPTDTTIPDLTSLLPQGGPLLLAQHIHSEISNLEFSNFGNFETISLLPTVCFSTTSSHNSSFSGIIKMEGDCDDNMSSPKLTTEMTELQKFLASLSLQMTPHMDCLQEQLIVNDCKNS
jgi:hypothetical protein